ncbi:MAG TPA: AAA family ATPase, partial [Candidatus Fimenecus excrementigallinarum]|nr:AAA family ATPase [Candidatus Fimenecus excrementigallinarum]
MLKYLHIKNFKGWKDSGKIEFAPITLFMGSNSSGKSSIGQFLMLLKQSSSTDRKTVLFLGDSNSVVELGGPVDMLYEHNTDAMLEFEYRWDIPELLTLSMLSNTDNAEDYIVNSITFADKIAVRDKEIQTLEVEKMIYHLHLKDQSDFSVGMERVQKASSARAYKTIAENYEIKRVLGRAWEMPSPYRFYGFPDEMISYHQNAWFAPQLNAAHENF